MDKEDQQCSNCRPSSRVPPILVQFMMKTVISNNSLVEISSVTDLPYVVLVETSLRNCFGVLIDALWVLTVAHCFGPLRTAMVVAGKAYWEKSDNKIQSYEVIIHPNYKKTKNTFQESSDLALIRLRDPILLTSDTKILQLEAEPWPQQSSEMYHRTCTTVGYTMGKSNKLSLHAYVTTAQHGQAGCACYEASAKQILVCLLDAKSPLCEDLPGSPLVCANKLTAIALKLFNLKSCYRTRKKIMSLCSDEDTINVYLYICPHLDWIKQHVLRTPSKPSSCKAPISSDVLIPVLYFILVFLLVV